MDPEPIRVLVVDDEPITAEAHAEYLRRIDGFTVAGIAGTGRETLRMLREAAVSVDGSPIDLILLDMNLPDTDGIELCRRIRAAGLVLDVIAITAVRDARTVRASVSLGVVQYVIKPFTFAAFADKLRGYRDFRRSLDATQVATQDDVDRAIAILRAPATGTLEKGLATETLHRVLDSLGTAQAGVSALELAERIGASRGTARRYLEFLTTQGIVDRQPRYGTAGRPEVEYLRRG